MKRKVAPPKVVILIERQRNKVFLWVDTHLIAHFRARHTHWHGKPMELAQVIQKAFATQFIESEIEINHESFDGPGT